MTNEQRAHDLALLYAQTIVKLDVESGNQVINFYAEYLKIYKQLLEQISNDFK